MKRGLLLIALVILSVPLFAKVGNEPIYGAFRGSAGQGKIQSLSDFSVTSYSAMPAVGYRLAPYLRVEAEYAYRTRWQHTLPLDYEVWVCDEVADEDDWSDEIRYENCVGGAQSILTTYRAHSLMAQGYIDIPFGKKSPFGLVLNGGIGGTHTKMRTPITRQADQFEEVLYMSGTTSRSMSWCAGGGLTYVYDKTLSIDVMYRYSDLGKFKVDQSTDRVRITLNELVVGARFTF